MSQQAKEPLYRVWLDDAAYALRALVATPRYSLPGLLSLALGIAASTAVFAIFSAIVLRPLPFPNEDELVNLRVVGASSEDQEGAASGLSYTYYSEFKELGSIFTSVSAFDESGMTITGRGEARHASVGRATPDFFDTLGAGAEIGRTFTAAGASPDAADVAVLSHSYWTNALGGAPVTGQTIVVNGAPKTIIGVIGDDRALPAHTDLWIPLQPSEVDRTGRFRLIYSGVARLKPGVSVEVAREMLRAAGLAQNVRSPDGTVVFGTLSSLRESLIGDKKTSASLMLVAVAAFLLLACANVASLLVTRASVRARELAIRAALGAGPSTLARQSGLEAAMLAVVGGIAGLLMAFALVHFANNVLGSELEYTPARLDGRVLLAFAAIAALSTAAIGLAPTLYALRVRPMDSLRAAGRSSSTRGVRKFRELLVAVQVAISLALLISASVLVRSVQRLHAIDPGFDPNAVAAHVVCPDARMDSPERKASFARAILERTAHLPGVTAAAIASDVPFGNDAIHLGLQMEPGAPREDVLAVLRLVGPGYFDAMGIPLLSGRAFSQSDSAKGVHHVVVNRAFATQFVGSLNALGHTLSFREHEGSQEGDEHPQKDGAQIWYDIVGVSEDTLEAAVTQPSQPTVYVDAEAPNAMALMGAGFMIVAHGSSDPTALLNAVTTVTRDVDRDSALFGVDTLGEMVKRSYGQRTSLEQLLGAFALAAIVLAAIGLFGVTSYAVAERSAEIGIRRALGASRGTIIRMILGETGVLVAIGVVGGLACAYSTRALLASFVYGVAAAEPIIYVAVCLGMGIIAMLAALAPARAAASVTPSRALEVR